MPVTHICSWQLLQKVRESVTFIMSSLSKGLDTWALRTSLLSNWMDMQNVPVGSSSLPKGIHFHPEDFKPLYMLAQLPLASLCYFVLFRKFDSFAVTLWKFVPSSDNFITVYPRRGQWLKATLCPTSVGWPGIHSVNILVKFTTALWVTLTFPQWISVLVTEVT